VRILLSTWSLQVGGGEILALNVAAGLARRGHEVFVFNQRAHLVNPELVKRLLPPEVRVLSLADRPWHSLAAYKADAVRQRLGGQAVYHERQQQAYLAACLRRYRIELLNSHATYSDRLCAPVARVANVPLVITEHGEYTQFTREGRQDFVPVLQAAQRILAVSNYCRQTLLDAWSGLPPVQTVYNGVIVTSAPDAAAAMRRQLGIPSEAFVVGMVARGRADKGWQCAIEAFQQLRAHAAGRPVRLVLVGGSEYLSQLQQAHTSETDIIFTGRVANSDFFIAGFDVGLLPTYFAAEALPLAIIEYMASGKPTIATRVGGIAELIEPASGATGQLLALDAHTGQPDPAALAQAMQCYYMNKVLYAMHATNARQASQSFSMDICVAHYEQLFTDLLAQRQGLTL
jgi:glycosyltransferase involved in cell wall biosynthesis